MSKSIPSGRVKTRDWGAASCSAKAPNGTWALTRSPTLQRVTPPPTPATTPAASRPGVKGRSGRKLVLALRHQGVREIETDGVDIDQHVLIPECRGRQVLNRVRAEGAEFAYPYTAHNVTSQLAVSLICRAVWSTALTIS